ncbi:DUF5941 domain-containing protein [Streptomonospora nanhaiensis]|uniref:DUF5941 domain-containing protein n=1 Tax=Streptomonospora nanhaiensis TaxID=1323731 RepID=A0A853BRX3_9ACTN|nr:DUF5941 domain-containing protein [Streptomonospora nanhaiensis]MBV2367091.1 hypothetical protein [Streptomonospora nanhaiensis]MBX9389556.1 hypothetical protein [Streptomonospora nanhaiensis]NYI97730.1 hypothetical protein [Streptomonospora nanhaiensis]
MGASPRPPARSGPDLRFLRDDGHLSTALGRLAAGGLPPLLPAVAGALVVGVLLVAGLNRLSGITLFAPVAALLLSGVASGHPHDGRFDRLVPPILRATEYLYLLALGYGSGVPGPLVFALVAVVALHHADAVHRTRCGVRPPAWLMRAMLGWDGRMLVTAVGGALGWLPFTYGVLAGYLTVLLVWEATTGWLATPIAEAEAEPSEAPRNDSGGVDASTG